MSFLQMSSVPKPRRMYIMEPPNHKLTQKPDRQLYYYFFPLSVFPPIPHPDPTPSFFRSTYRAHGLGGLYTGYAFTFCVPSAAWGCCVVRILSAQALQRFESEPLIQILRHKLNFVPKTFFSFFPSPIPPQQVPPTNRVERTPHLWCALSVVVVCSFSHRHHIRFRPCGRGCFPV